MVAQCESTSEVESTDDLFPPAMPGAAVHADDDPGIGVRDHIAPLQRLSPRSRQGRISPDSELTFPDTYSIGPARIALHERFAIRSAASGTISSGFAFMLLRPFAAPITSTESHRL